MSINLSGYQFNNLAVSEAIQDIIRETGAEAARLTFEITETSALENIGLADKFIRRLKKFGCRFALDDFGAGYTSLSHLRNIPLDAIKIDCCFVQRLDQSPRDQALVAAVTDMGHALDSSRRRSSSKTADRSVKNMGGTSPRATTSAVRRCQNIKTQFAFGDCPSTAPALLCLGVRRRRRSRRFSRPFWPPASMQSSARPEPRGCTTG